MGEGIRYIYWRFAVLSRKHILVKDIDALVFPSDNVPQSFMEENTYLKDRSREPNSPLEDISFSLTMIFVNSSSYLLI